MTKVTYLLLVWLLSFGAYAQPSTPLAIYTPDDLGKIQISVVIERNSDKLSSAQLSKLETKLLAIVTQSGASGEGYSSNFVMHPKFEIYDVQTVEGMRNLKVVDANLTLIVRQQSNNAVFATYTARLQGSATNESQAIDNAISKVNPSDAQLKAFINEAKNKIIKFYDGKCLQISKEADRLANTGDIERAMAVLANVPVEAENCYTQLENQAINLFKRYQKRHCNQIMLQANARIAANAFCSGLKLLALVDPESPCFTDAKKVIASTESKINEIERREWELILLQTKNQFELNKYYINAVRDMTVAYYNRRPEVRVSIHNFLF